MLYNFKSFVYQNKNILSGGLAVSFSLTKTGTGSERIFNAGQAQPIIENIITPEAFWDTGAPKGHGEFLVYGSAYSAKPVRGLGVNVRVGEISKLLMVFGDRVWNHTFSSEATPFKVIPLNYNYAFGGAGYELNPLGKGYLSETEVGLQLPNIESLDEVITSRTDTPHPAGFEPYPITWPQRSQYFSAGPAFTHESEIIEDFMLPEYFNTAPLDQRLKGFFRGDESIEIKHMHQFLPTISSTLPGLRLRLFVVRANGPDDHKFEEIPTQAETLFLLPNLELGILMFRTTCVIADISASDISYIYCALEELTRTPETIEYYYNHMLKQIDPDGNNTKSQEKEKTAEECINVFYEKLQQVEAGEDTGLPEPIESVLLQLNEMMKHFKITREESENLVVKRRNENLPPVLSGDEILELLKSGWEKDPKLEKKLRKTLETMDKFNHIIK